MKSYLKFQTASLPNEFWTCSPHNHVRQLLKISLSMDYRYIDDIAIDVDTDIDDIDREFLWKMLIQDSSAR